MEEGKQEHKKKKIVLDLFLKPCHNIIRATHFYKHNTQAK